MKGKDKIETLDDLYRSNGFQMFDSDRRGNQMFLDDPERAERCYERPKMGQMVQLMRKSFKTGVIISTF